MTQITNWPIKGTPDWYFQEWSPDGQWLAYLNPSLPGDEASENGLYVTNMSCLSDNSTCHSKTIGPFPQAIYPPLAWSPDNKSIVVAYKDEFLSIFEIDTGNFQKAIPINHYFYPEHTMAWSPDGEKIAVWFINFELSRGELNYLDVKNRKLELIRTPDEYLIHGWINIPLPFQKNEIYFITEVGANLNLRDNPTLAGSVLKEFKEKDLIAIVDGPIQADGYEWWKMRASDGTEGWAVNIADWYEKVTP